MNWDNIVGYLMFLDVAMLFSPQAQDSLYHFIHKEIWWCSMEW